MTLWKDRPTAMGCMRLSTTPHRDEEKAVRVIHAALDAGVRLLDTADVYCLDERDIGHNERLIRRALSSWTGDRSSVVVATKGGLRRPGGRWEPDGRAKHLRKACEASRKALNVDSIDLYQLHAPDPRTDLATSVRALASMKEEGLVEAVGLCNVTVGQIEKARRITEIDTVQVELSPWHSRNVRNGVAEYCASHGIAVIAYRPLGGTRQAPRLSRHPVLGKVALEIDASPAEVALTWLRGLSRGLVPLPGPSRESTARSAGRIGAIELSAAQTAALDAEFPFARLFRVPRSERRPDKDSPGDVVLIMGLPAAGKSNRAAGYVERGYQRLNRDSLGGRLKDLIPRLDEMLSSGRKKVVLDNTYLSRETRNLVVEAAWKQGVPVRCEWVKTPLQEAQVNAVTRMVRRYGKLLTPEEIAKTARKDPQIFAPNVLFRSDRLLEPPAVDEGFETVDEIDFIREENQKRRRRALILEYEGGVRRSRKGAPTPVEPDDVELMPKIRRRVESYLKEDWLVLGTSWQPGLARNQISRETVESCLSRTHKLLGREVEVVHCPHPPGPPICWCRKPLPGLGVLLIERHQLDPARCLHVGKGASDRTFASRLGFRYLDYKEFLEESSC